MTPEEAIAKLLELDNRADNLMQIGTEYEFIHWKKGWECYRRKVRKILSHIDTRRPINEDCG